MSAAVRFVKRLYSWNLKDWLSREPNRGTSKSLAPEDLDEVYSTDSGDIEKLAVRLAVQNHTPEQIAHARSAK